MKITPAEAAARLVRLKNAASSFPGFCEAVWPKYRFAPFQFQLMETLDGMEKGTVPYQRLLINMPPRHGKSFIANEAWPIYYMARNPERHVLTVSYNESLAQKFGRSARDLAREQIVQQTFPDFRMSTESRAVDDWRTMAGGTYYATGLGGSTTGRPANCLIIDDPLKAREEAESATMRNKVWSYYTSALTTRKQPEANGRPPLEIVIMTRWHPDDLAGRLMETEDWKEGLWLHISLPAITRTKSQVAIPRTSLPPDHPEYMHPDDLDPKALSPAKELYYPVTETTLWPERFPLDAMKKRERLDPREFASLYQQTPYIAGGNLIKAPWFRYTKVPPAPELITASIIAADTAFKKKEDTDYSVMLFMAITELGDIHILDMLRERLNFPELRRAASIFNAKHRGSALRGLYIEDRASGQSLIQELRQESGMAVLGYKPLADKVARVNLVTPLIEGGRVFLPSEAPWLDAFIQEVQQFPSGKHDDIVDALSMGLDVLSRMGGSAPADLNKPILETLDRYNQNFGPSLSKLAKRRGPTSKLPDWAKAEFVRWGEL